MLRPQVVVKKNHVSCPRRKIIDHGVLHHQSTPSLSFQTWKKPGIMNLQLHTPDGWIDNIQLPLEM